MRKVQAGLEVRCSSLPAFPVSPVLMGYFSSLIVLPFSPSWASGGPFSGPPLLMAVNNSALSVPIDAVGADLCFLNLLHTAC